MVKGAASLNLAKHRNGEPGRVQLKFIGESTKFVDVDAQNMSDEAPEFSHVAHYDDSVPETAEDDGYDPIEMMKTAAEKNAEQTEEERPFE